MSRLRPISPGKTGLSAFSGLRGYPDFSEYYSGDQRFAPFQLEVRNRKYAIGDTNVKYRNLDHWEERGLLPEGADTRGRGWRRFNLIEVVWIEALNRLREFGISLDKIAKVKEAVLEWNSNYGAYPTFEYFVAKAITQSEDVFVVMCRNGNAGILSSSEIEVLKTGDSDRDLLLISIKSILSDLGIEAAHSQVLFCLSKEEADYIRHKRIADAENTSQPRKDFADFFASFEDGSVTALEIKRNKRS